MIASFSIRGLRPKHAANASAGAVAYRFKAHMRKARTPFDQQKIDTEWGDFKNLSLKANHIARQRLGLQERELYRNRLPANIRTIDMFYITGVRCSVKVYMENL